MTDVVNVGSTDNDGNGDTLRAAFSQINTRFNELLSTIDGGDAWATGVTYTATPIRQWVIESGQAYVAAVNHVSGASFAADLSAGKWFAVDSAQILADLAAPTGAGLVGFSPTGTIASTTVQTAIEEIKTDLAASSGASLVGYLPAGTGAVATDVQTKLRESVSVKDFGAVGDGVNDDTAAFVAAEAAHDFLYLPEGSYLITYAPTKTFLGPGDIVTGGVSALTFAGVGVNDATVTGNYDGAFPLQIVARITNPATADVATTGFSASAGIGTLTFGGGATYPVGSWVELAGVSVTSGTVNGKQFVLGASAGQITFYTAATGSQTVAGTVSDFDEFELSFNGGATYTEAYQAYDPNTDNDKSVRYTVNTYASPITAPVTSTRVFGFDGLTIQWATSRGHTSGATWAFTLTQKAEKLFTYGNAVYLNGARALTVESNRSIGIGPNVFGNLNSIGVENIGVGINALKNNTTGYQNIGISSDTLTTNESGGANIAIGGSALHDNIAGSDNIAIGLYSQYRTTGYNNVSVGVDSLRQNYAGTENVAVGTQAMYSVENGTDNVAVGLYALRGGTSTFPTGITNNYCTAVGAKSQNITQNAAHNASLGFESLYNATGSYNTAIGSEAGFRTTTGQYNLFAGYNAGADASQSATASYCVVLGREAYATGDNAIAIGSSVIANANHIAIGNASHTGFYIYGNLTPQTDNSQSIGNGGARWSVVYAGTGTINTSDARTKQQIAELTASERAVAVRLKSLIRTFKFNDAVESKGDSARIHVGVIAQDVKAAFEAEGLVAEDYALLCYDEWEAEPEVMDAEGNVFKPAVLAGNRYGVRYEELLAFIIAAL